MHTSSKKITKSVFDATRRDLFLGRIYCTRVALEYVYIDTAVYTRVVLNLILESKFRTRTIEFIRPVQGWPD